MKPHILVVDDTRDNLRLLSNILTEQGYKVRPVPDGCRAISSAQNRPPDLILLDIMMPDMDGYDVCERLKADERTRDIPVIFLSALNETIDKVRAFQIGGVDYITKPFQDAEVLARVKTHLELADMRKRLQAQNTQLQRTNDQLTREIIEHKRTKDALQRAKDAALEAQHMAEDAQKASEAAQKASEAANQAKSVFLSNMSHELRSPLTAILGFAEVMTRAGLTGSSPLPPEHQEHVNIIRRSGEHLLTLINQVLDLSKIEAGRTTLNSTNFDLHALLDDVRDMFQLRAAEKRVHLLFEQAENVPRFVRTDDVRLRQVLINLLNNAIKFTEAGEVRLKIENCLSNIEECEGISSTRHSSLVTLQFSISDTGPGIASEDMEKIFEAFGQTETGRKSQKGTGLGLPISRKFVQMMGGDMRVQSDVGRGTIFTFDIRCHVVDSRDTRHATRDTRVIALESGQPRYRILIADDRWTNRQLVVKLLNPLDFELREAVNGQEAIDIWETWKPHFIWMDMRMPVLDGYEATKKIRKLETGNWKLESRGLEPDSPVSSFQFQTKIIALTASSLEEERAVALDAGCDDYLRKPFRESDVFELLSKHLGARFVYEEEDQPAESKEQEAEQNILTAEALAALPAEWLRHLAQGAEDVDVELLFSVIEQIRGHDAALADALTQVVENFEYDEILTVIQQIEHGG